MYTIRKSFVTPHFFSAASGLSNGPSETAPAIDSVDQLIAQAKGKLEEAKRLNDDIIAGRLLHDSFVSGKDSTVEGLLSQIETKNSANKTKIDTLVNSALNDSEWKKDPKMYAELQKLATKFKTENIAVVEQKAVAKDAVAEETGQKVAVEKKSAPSYAKGVSVRNPESTSGFDKDRLSGRIEKESNPDKKKFLECVNVLCDFDGSWGVESKNEINILSANSQKQEIGELQTANILIDQFGDSKKLESLLSRFGDNVSLADLDNPEKAKGIRESFVKNVIAKANLMSQISRVITGNPDASVGLISVLNGTEKQFIENLKSQNPDLSKLTEAGKKDKRWFQMAVNFLMSLGVQVATGGLFSVGVEHREIGEGHPFAYVLGDKVNFTAKIRALSGVIQGNWNDRERAIIKTTVESAKSLEEIILKSDFDVAKNEKDIVALIPESQKEKTTELLRNLDSTLLSNEASKKAFIDVLTRNVMIGLAEKEEAGWEMKGVEASLDIMIMELFLGGVGQKIHTKIRDGAFTGANLAETAVNGGKKKLSELGIKYERTKEGKFSYSLPADMENIQGLESLGVVTKGENGALNVVSEKPLQFIKTSNYKLDGSIEDTWIVSAVPNRKVTTQKKVTTTSTASIESSEIPDMFSTDMKEAFAKYPGYREWRRVFPQTFGIIRENLLVNGDADKALSDARKKVKPTAEFGKFLASLDAKTPEQKSEILSALINENAGVARFRQYGADEKKETETFGKVYSATKSDKRVDAAFDENEARTLYGKSHADMMKDQSPEGDDYRKLYAEKVELRSSNKATLTQSKEKTKPIEVLSADTGFFTFQNFAEYNGKGTRFHALKSQPTSQVLVGTVKEMTSFPGSAKKELLAQSAADKRYNKRFDALLTSINTKLPDKKIDKAGLLTILQGDTVSGVKLSESLKFYRAESAVCANDMITIGKPKFQIEGNTEEVTVTDVPDVSEDVIVGTTAIMGERKAEVIELSAGLNPMGINNLINPSKPNNPTTPGATPVNPTTPGATPVNPTTPGATVSTTGTATNISGVNGGAAFGS